MKQWDELEHSAIAIAEAVNLIKMVGRPMAQPGEMNVDPEGPELPPAQIAAQVNRTRAQWNKYANALQDLRREDADGRREEGRRRVCSISAAISTWRARTATSNTGIPDDKKNRK